MLTRSVLLLLIAAPVLVTAGAQGSRPALVAGAALGIADGPQVVMHLSAQLRAGPRWRLRNGAVVAAEGEIGRRTAVGDCVSLGSCPSGFNFTGGSVGLGWEPGRQPGSGPFTLLGAAGAYRVSWAPDRNARWEDQHRAALGLSATAAVALWRGRNTDIAITGRALVFPRVGGTRLWTFPLGLQVRGR